MSDYKDFPAKDMTARDEFTKAAMVAILSNPALTNESNYELVHYPSDLGHHSSHLAMNAMRYADAALQALEDFK